MASQAMIPFCWINSRFELSVELVNLETKKKFDLSLTKRQLQFVKEGKEQVDNPTRIVSFSLDIIFQQVKICLIA